jgi:inositol transport system substrate-binding protein
MGGCGKKEEDGKIKIGVAVSSFDDQFLINMVDAMKAYTKEVYSEEVQISFVDAKDDAAKQLGQVENFVTQGMDGVIVIAVDTDAVDPMTKLCVSEGVKISYVNRMPASLPEGAFYAGSEEIKAGEMQGEFISEKLNGKGNVGILMGVLGHNAQIKRTDGVKKIVAKHPGMKVVKEQTGKWQRSEAMQVMENWIASGVKIDAVVANNDEMAIGALNAIEANGLLGQILVVGVDATPDALDSISKEKLNASVFQDGAGQAKGGIDAIFKSVKGEAVEQYNWIPFKLVTPENYKDFQ